MKIETVQAFMRTTGVDIGTKVLAALPFWTVGRRLIGRVVSLPDFRLEGPQIAVRPYTHDDHYWQVWFDTDQAISRVCAEAGWPAPTHRVVQVPA